MEKIIESYLKSGYKEDGERLLISEHINRQGVIALNKIG